MLADNALNVIVYVPFGALFYLTAARRSRVFALVIPAIAAFLLSCCMETMQLFAPGRVTSLIDVLCNTAGAVVGEAGALLLARRLHPVRAQAHMQSPSALLLLVFWGAYSTAPFMPQLHGLAAKLPRVRSFTMLGLLAATVEIVAVLALLERVEIRRAWQLLVPLLVFARILIVDRIVTMADVAGLVIGFAVWEVIPRQRSALIAILVGISVVFEGLSPFHFSSHPNPFLWIPFAGSLASVWELSIVVLLRKLFTYGSLVWFLHDARVRTSHAAIVTAALLAAIEILQIYLPGRTAEITDPLIAGILAAIFALADRRDSRENCM